MEQAKKRLTVGSGGIDPRDVRLIEIVFRHSQYNPIEFELQTRLELKTAEVLLINPMTEDGLKALAKLRTSGLNIPVISVVPRGASPGSKYAIALDRLTLQLLPMLNKVVEDHYGHESGNGAVNKSAAIREMLVNQRLPEPTTDTRRCRECSLKDVCQPEAARALRAGTAGLRELFEPGSL